MLDLLVRIARARWILFWALPLHWKISAFALLIALYAWEIIAPIAIPRTESMPFGVYVRIPATPRVGDIAEACPTPLEVAYDVALKDLATSWRSNCPRHALKILKYVAAVGPGRFTATACGMIVAAGRIDRSARIAGGPPPLRDISLAPGEVIFWSPHPLSSDSRYWGPYRGAQRMIPLVQGPWRYHAPLRFVDPAAPCTIAAKT